MIERCRIFFLCLEFNVSCFESRIDNFCLIDSEIIDGQVSGQLQQAKTVGSLGFRVIFSLIITI